MNPCHSHPDQLFYQFVVVVWVTKGIWMEESRKKSPSFWVIQCRHQNIFVNQRILEMRCIDCFWKRLTICVHTYILIPHFNSCVFLFSMPPNVFHICKILNKSVDSCYVIINFRIGWKLPFQCSKGFNEPKT